MFLFNAMFFFNTVFGVLRFAVKKMGSGVRIFTIFVHKYTIINGRIEEGQGSYFKFEKKQRAEVCTYKLISLPRGERGNTVIVTLRCASEDRQSQNSFGISSFGIIFGFYFPKKTRQKKHVLDHPCSHRLFPPPF